MLREKEFENLIWGILALPERSVEELAFSIVLIF